MQAWYRDSWTRLLQPLAWIFKRVSERRRRQDLARQVRVNAPVIIVGNITVGGTGKTPLVLMLLAQLQRQGWRPGVVSRGYGGRARHYPVLVDQMSAASEVGDEPLLIASRSACPVVVDPDRVKAAQYLLAISDCNIVVSDDGLQHYRLARDIEIAVVDGQRRFGNGHLLPAGPLREEVSRLQAVDFVVCNGEACAGEYEMQLAAVQWVNVADSNKTLAPAGFSGQAVHAVAGIGNPTRFFTYLQQLDCRITEHAFADHHRFCARDLEFGDALPVLMTEKDAVKCRRFAKPNHWYLQIHAELSAEFMIKFFEKLANVKQE